jgi:DNA polymerase-1
MAELVGMGGLKEEAQDGMGAIVKAVKAALRKKTPDAINAAFEKLGIPTAIESAVRLGVPVENFMYALLPYETLTRYNARDSVATKRLGILMNEQLRLEPNLFRVWKDQVLPAAVALERIEGWGVATSKVAIRTFDHFLESRERTLKLTLDAYGADINWDSRDQVAELLFKKLRLPTLKMTATGKASTDAETLEFVAEKSGHPLPKALLDYRFVTKLRGTYSQGLYDHIKADGRIHPNIKLDGARSGRTSCTDPNLQNIPRADSPEGKMARDCFVAPPDHYLVETDYSQLELRVAAMLSGDKVMQEIFSSGIDYHLRTAQMVSRVAWGIAPEQVTDKHRSLAKSVNFGVLYGKTARTLAKEWGVAQHKAEAIVNAIMGNFKQLQKWTARQQAEASKTGEIWTWWKGHKARRRPMWQIADQDDARASVARNGAVNTPIQGTASDFCIASLTAAVAWIEDDGLEDLVKLILAVHDSLMFEVHSSMVNETISTTHDIMTSHESMGVPLVADFKVGRSWGSMVKIKPGQDFRKVLADAEAAAGAR